MLFTFQFLPIQCEMGCVLCVCGCGCACAGRRASGWAGVGDEGIEGVCTEVKVSGSCMSWGLNVCLVAMYVHVCSIDNPFCISTHTHTSSSFPSHSTHPSNAPFLNPHTSLIPLAPPTLTLTHPPLPVTPPLPSSSHSHRCSRSSCSLKDSTSTTFSSSQTISRNPLSSWSPTNLECSPSTPTSHSFSTGEMCVCLVCVGR